MRNYERQSLRLGLFTATVVHYSNVCGSRVFLDWNVHVHYGCDCSVALEFGQLMCQWHGSFGVYGIIGRERRVILSPGNHKP